MIYLHGRDAGVDTLKLHDDGIVRSFDGTPVFRVTDHTVYGKGCSLDTFSETALGPGYAAEYMSIEDTVIRCILYIMIHDTVETVGALLLHGEML